MNGAKKVLLIEDEQDLVKAIRMRFESAGYEVLEACDGAAGLELAKGRAPDLIILDLMLPKIAGYNVARLLREDENCKDIPILILSARGQDIDIKIGMAVGADAYLVKPFDPQNLLDTAAGLLNKKSPGRREGRDEKENPDS